MSAPDSPSFSAQNPLWREAHRAFLDALFPPRCAGCASWSREVFCSQCTPQLRPIRAPLCRQCGQPFDPLALPAPICSRCRARVPHFLAARAAFHFEGPLRAAIHRLKYRQKSALAQRLAPLLAQTFDQDALLCEFDPHFIVPIPLHRARLKTRGFNQSALLCHQLSPLIGVPTLELLRRTRNTPPQVSLKGKERADNVKGAFVATENTIEWRGARVLLIDDVFTTGSTLGEAAKTLRGAGAGAVCALTLAR